MGNISVQVKNMNGAWVFSPTTGQTLAFAGCHNAEPRWIDGKFAAFVDGRRVNNSLPCKKQGCEKTNIDYAGVCPSHR